MSRQRPRRINRSSKLETIPSEPRGEDDVFAEPSWRGELGRGGAAEGPRSKPTLPRVEFLERPDLSKR
jgi:hypothetical protein